MGTLTIGNPETEQLCPGRYAQTNRLTAWCAEIARAMHLSPESLKLLQMAASGGSAEQHLQDHDQRLYSVLEHIRHFDEQLEYAPFEDEEIGTVLRSTIETGDPACLFVLGKLRVGSRADVEKLIPKLPVYPAVASRILDLLAEEDVSAPDLEKMAKLDAVLAGNLLNVANSAYFSPRQPIRGLTQAIAYLGLGRTRQSLVASSVQQLFTKSRMLSVWRHSLEAADVAERIAGGIPSVDPHEAFLLGLLHDVGRLLITSMPDEANASIHRLVANGCQPILAEMVICGFDHAEAGAEVLAKWNFPEEWRQAIRYHHQPERSKSVLSSLLYLTEFWVSAEEDLPSTFRFNSALERVGLSRTDLQRLLAGKGLDMHDLLAS